MIQLVQPNLSTVGNIGYCLAMQENVWATAHLYATATEAFHATQFKHLDRNLPDVAVPVWFSYFQNGVDYGHVATYVPGKGVLSSPYKADGTQQWFKDIDQCASVLNCHYLGWSEDIANVRVAEGEPMVTEQDINNLYPPILGRAADPGALGYVGKNFHDFTYDIIQSDEFKNRIGQIAELETKVDELTKANLDLAAKLQGQPAPAPVTEPAPVPAPVQPDAELVTQVKENNSLLNQLLAKLGSIFK